jgi:hypothetical protein
VEEIIILTILTLVTTGTVEVTIVVDEITEMEILETAIVDTTIETQVDEIVETEVAEVAEVAEDVEEEMEIDHKATMHAQFMVDTSGRNVFLILMGTITDHEMVMEMETARVEEMARGEATPTIQIRMIRMVALRMEVKEMAPTTTTTPIQVTRTTVIVEMETTTLTIETATTIIWPTLEYLIGIRND